MVRPDGIEEPGAFLDAMDAETPSDDFAVALMLDFLIGKHAPDQLADAILPRVGDLRGVRGELILGLIEGLARDDLLDGLANSLVDQPGLAPDRIWMALEILEGTGRIEERPSLVALREDIEELLADDASLTDLAREIEADPETIPAAIDALSRIEPDIRVEIIAGLGREPATPSLLALMAMLADSRDDATREVASEALRFLREQQLRGKIQAENREVATAGEPPLLLASVIGPLDGDGRAIIALVSGGVEQALVLRFDCDIREGIIAVRSEGPISPCEAMPRWEEVAESLGPEATRGCPISSWLLLTGAAWLSGAELRADVQIALVAAFGERFVARPIFAPLESSRTNDAADASIRLDAQAVLSRRGSWRDDSELARGLAFEMRLRDGGQAPDPVRDPGQFRVLFEGRILGRLELYRRMLLWSAMVWEEVGESQISRAASRIAVGLSDPQNAVPAYPFVEELMIRSLSDARSSDFEIRPA